MVSMPTSWFAILFSLLIAATLEHLAFPLAISFLRPEWMLLVLLYWLLRGPEKVGLFTVAAAGLVMDVIRGSYLGVHMASMSIVAYLVLSMHQRLKMFPIWQQCFVAFFLVSIYLMITNGLRAALTGSGTGFQFLWLAAGSALVWPLITIINDRIAVSLR